MTMYSAETPLAETKTPNGMNDEQTEDESFSEDTDWLALARDAYTESDDYFDSSIRRDQETALAHFNNRHAPGSKYYSQSYKYRARGFRPKSRSVVRRNEAAAAKAFFSTKDLVSVQAEDPSDPAQLTSAELMHEIMNYRLSTTIPWFKLLVGAFQDTLVAGPCISYQYWKYNETSGEDEPCIELRPVENVLFAPGTDWLNPMSSSPYLIDKIPMIIGDVKQKIASGEWLDIDETKLKISVEEYDDSVRSQREGDRQNSKDASHSETDFDNCWVHRNIIRQDGVDYLYYTLGTHAMLSDPIPLLEVYSHLRDGERPYVMGYSMIETHKTYPASLVTLTKGLQQEANDISNQRRDNVALVLNKRYYVRRGSGIDMRSLTNNVPGSVTLMGDIDNDIRTESPPEVTGSAFQEQDRVNMDYDELAGSFSQSSVGTNRALAETVGGMDIMQGDANEIMEYQLRVFVETWVEPVLRQLIRLEQAYETDEAVLKLAGRNAKMLQRFGINEITDRMLQGNMTLDLNVGFGATNPQKRVEKLTLALRSLAEFKPELIQKLDEGEIIKEVMGSLGYKDGKRFFPKAGEEPDPQVQQLQQQVQQLQQQLQSGIHLKQEDYKRAVDVEKIRAQASLQEEQLKLQAKQGEIQTRAQVEMSKAQMKAEVDRLGKEIEHSKSEIERGKLINARDMLLWKMELEGATFKRDSRAQAAQPIEAAQADTESESASMELPNPEDRDSIVLANDNFGALPNQAE